MRQTRRVTPTDAYRIRPRLGLLVASVLLGGLSACGAQPDDIEAAFEGVEGIADLDTTCAELSCTLKVDLEQSATADQLAEVIRVVRELDVSTEILTADQVTLLAPNSASELDAAISAAAIALGPITTDAQIFPGGGDGGGPRVQATAGTGEPFWRASRDVWAAVEEVPDVRLSLVGARSTRLEVEDAYPEPAATLVEELQRKRAGAAGLRLNGVVLTPTQLSISVADLGGVGVLRAAVEQHPLARQAPPVDVHVTENGELEGVAGTPELTRALTVLDERPDVRDAVETSQGLEIRLAPGSEDDLRDLYDAIRPALEGTGVDVHLELAARKGQAGEVGLELPVGGDPELVTLVQRVLEESSDLAGLWLTHPNAEPELVIDYSSRRMAPKVEALARTVADWVTTSRPDSDTLLFEVDSGLEGSYWSVDLTGAKPTLNYTRDSDGNEDEEIRRAWRRGMGG